VQKFNELQAEVKWLQLWTRSSAVTKWPRDTVTHSRSFVSYLHSWDIQLRL